MITVLKKCPISESLLGLRLYHSPHKNVIFLSFSRTTTMIAVLAKSYVSESLWNCDHNRSAQKNALFLVFIRTAIMITVLIKCPVFYTDSLPTMW